MDSNLIGEQILPDIIGTAVVRYYSKEEVIDIINGLEEKTVILTPHFLSSQQIHVSCFDKELTARTITKNGYIKDSVIHAHKTNDAGTDKLKAQVWESLKEIYKKELAVDIDSLQSLDKQKPIIDAPDSLDVTSDKIHNMVLSMSDGQCKVAEINGNVCQFWADFDCFIDGDRYYRYGLEIDNKALIENLNFSQITQSLNRAITTPNLADRINAEQELPRLKPGEYKTVDPELLKYVNSEHIQQLVGSNDIRDLGIFLKEKYNEKLISLEQFMEFNKTSAALVEARKKMNQVAPEKVNEFTGRVEEKLDSLLYLKARNFSLETYCKNAGYALQRAGDYMRVSGLAGAENDMVLIKGNSFTAKDGEISGDTVSFVRKYENKSKNEAIIDILASGKNISRTQDFEKDMKIAQPALSR